MDRDVGTVQIVEIMSALQKLGEQLTSKEQAFLNSHATDSLKLFEKASTEIGRLKEITFCKLRFQLMTVIFKIVAFKFFCKLYLV